MIQIVVRRAIRQITGNDLAAEHIGLALESPGKLAEDDPEIQAQERPRARSPSTTSLTTAGVQGVSQANCAIQGPRHGDDFAQDREHAQAPHEEEAEVEQMAVGDVADLVSEDRRDFVAASRTRSGHRSAEHSGNAARSPSHRR